MYTLTRPTMADRFRRHIGNEAEAGTHSLEPAYERGRQAALRDYQTLRARRQQLIDVVAAPPPLPGAKKVAPLYSGSPSFNQFAYSVLLIAVLAAVAIATSWINWEFLIYGALAVLARLPSSQMFIAALINLLIIPVATIFKRDSLANTFSVMAFYF